MTESNAQHGEQQQEHGTKEEFRSLIRLYRAGGHVYRLHTVPTLLNETVAQHTFGVMSILRALYHPAWPPNRLLVRALDHDMPEQYTGDMPAPIKWKSDVIDEALKDIEADWWDEAGIVPSPLRVEEYYILKAADMLDLILKCNEELNMGNKNRLGMYKTSDIISNGITYISGLDLPEWVREKVDYVIQMLTWQEID